MGFKLPSKTLLEKHSEELDDKKYYNLSKLVNQQDFKNKLVFPVGIDSEKEKYFIDFEQKSSLLISGETGSGKSVFINSIIISLLLKNTPDELQFVLIDPRGVELNCYNGIPHLYDKVFTNKEESLKAFDYVTKVIQERTSLFIRSGKNDIESYNESSETKLSHIIVILDEIIDIMDSKEIKAIVNSILSIGYKFGIHLILSTNSYFKTYFDNSTIDLFNYILTFDLASEEQANYIKIDNSNLLSVSGEALIKCQGNRIINIQTPYVSNRDIEEVVNFLLSQNNSEDNDEDI